MAGTLSSTSRGLVACVGCVIIVAFGVWLVDAQFRDIILIQAAQHATSQVRLGVLSHVNAADFAPPYTTERLADLDARLAPILAPISFSQTGVVAVNLVALDRTIVYSASPRVAGEQVGPSDESLLREVLEGRVDAEVDSLSAPEDWSLTALHDDLFEVFVPVIIDGTVVGAYEVYEDFPRFRAVRLLLLAVLACGVATVVITAANLRGRRIQPARAGDADDAPSTAQRAEKVRLTDRELDVLGLLARGRSYRDVAADLTLSEETVRSHVKRILRKMGQPNSTAAAVAAVRTGILHLLLQVSHLT